MGTLIEAGRALRPVELLVGSRAIAKFLRISNSRVLAMEKQGAPIMRDQTGVMRAEKWELWGWWRSGA